MFPGVRPMSELPTVQHRGHGSTRLSGLCYTSAAVVLKSSRCVLRHCNDEASRLPQVCGSKLWRQSSSNFGTWLAPASSHAFWLRERLSA